MRLKRFKAGLQRLALMGTTLWLTLCCVGCANSRRYFPAVSTAPNGNAVLATLPTGTEIRFNENHPEIVRAFVNETIVICANSNGSFVLKTIAPLKLATPEYIQERDERELKYIEIIENLKIQQEPKAAK